MLEHVFEDGSILCIPENSIEYIHTYPAEKGWPVFDKNGNPRRNDWGDIICEKDIKLHGVRIVYKYTFNDDTVEMKFYPKSPELNINDDEEYNKFMSFLKWAFVKNNKKYNF